MVFDDLPDDPANLPGPLAKARNAIPAPLVRAVSDQAEMASMIAEPSATPKIDRVVSAQDSLPSQGGFTSPKVERAFRAWHKAASLAFGLDPDPDAATNGYDWRRAFAAGAKPKQDKSGAWVWPADFVITPAREGDRMPIPDWAGGVPASEHPTFELKTDMEEPAYRKGLGIWRRGNSI